MPTDKKILDWLEREGLESLVRCPQFERDGSSLGIVLWKSHWKPDDIYTTMREAAIAGMKESERVSMTAKQAADLYRSQGLTPPEDLATSGMERIRGRIKKEIDGHLFDSTTEALAYRVLRQWEQAGAIKSLALQPSFTIVPPGKNAAGRKTRAREYRADFRFIRGDEDVVVDVKGFRTEVYKLKLALFRYQYPFLVFEEWSTEKVRELAKQ